jgi:hypothetical protein
MKKWVVRRLMGGLRRVSDLCWIVSQGLDWLSEWFFGVRTDLNNLSFRLWDWGKRGKQ